MSLYETEFTGLKMSSRPKSQTYTVTDVPHINLATTQICRDKLLTQAPKSGTPPLKMQSLCHGGRLTIEVMNTTITHRENVKGTVHLHEQINILPFFYSPSYCSKHIWYAPETTKSILKIVHRTHTLHRKCSEATILKEMTKTKEIFKWKSSLTPKHFT